jgi:hypothetical protein
LFPSCSPSARICISSAGDEFPAPPAGRLAAGLPLVRTWHVRFLYVPFVVTKIWMLNSVFWQCSSDRRFWEPGTKQIYSFSWLVKFYLRSKMDAYIISVVKAFDKKNSLLTRILYAVKLMLVCSFWKVLYLWLKFCSIT